VRRKKPQSAPHQERILSDGLLGTIFHLLVLYRGKIRITLIRNLALLTHALLTLFQGARGAMDFYPRPLWLDAFRWGRRPRAGNRGFPGSWKTPG